MSDIAIHVEGLGKQYHIGGPQQQYKTLRESLIGAVTGPLRRLRHPQSVTRDRETSWALSENSWNSWQKKDWCKFVSFAAQES